MFCSDCIHEILSIIIVYISIYNITTTKIPVSLFIFKVFDVFSKSGILLLEVETYWPEALEYLLKTNLFSTAHKNIIISCEFHGDNQGIHFDQPYLTWGNNVPGLIQNVICGLFGS